MGSTAASAGEVHRPRTGMSIFPLPVFEADVDPANRDALTLEEQLEQLEAPATMVVRFGRMGEVGEYKQAGDIRAGCGSKLVARTHRGTEIVDMLTTTCSNSGCGKSVSRQEMRDYIENSGGQEFPFHTNGRRRKDFRGSLMFTGCGAPHRLKHHRQTLTACINHSRLPKDRKHCGSKSHAVSGCDANSFQDLTRMASKVGGLLGRFRGTAEHS